MLWCKQGLVFLVSSWLFLQCILWWFLFFEKNNHHQRPEVIAELTSLQVWASCSRGLSHCCPLYDRHHVYRGPQFPFLQAQNRVVNIWLHPRGCCDLQLINISKALSSRQKKGPRCSPAESCGPHAVTQLAGCTAPPRLPPGYFEIISRSNT